MSLQEECAAAIEAFLSLLLAVTQKTSVTVCYKIIIMIIIRTIMQSGPVYIKQLLRQVVTSGLLPVYLHPYSS